MPIDMLIDYLRSHKKSMQQGYYEVYIVAISEQAQQVLTYKENPCVMGYDYMVEYFKNFRSRVKKENPMLYYRSVGVFYPLDEVQEQIQGFSGYCLR